VTVLGMPGEPSPHPVPEVTARATALQFHSLLLLVSVVRENASYEEQMGTVVRGRRSAGIQANTCLPLQVGCASRAGRPSN